MKLNVLVKTNSKKESVTILPDGTATVRVNAPPIEGKANKRIIELLAEYYGVPRSKIQLLHGSKGKKKVFEIS